MAEFRLVIATPEREFFKGNVETLVLTAEDGELGIMAGHEPMVVATVESEIRIKSQGEWCWAAASSGFAIVMQDEVMLMLQTAEWPEEIDINRAKRDEYIAKEALRQKQSMQEYHLARSMLARAMTRLRVSNRHNYNS